MPQSRNLKVVEGRFLCRDRSWATLQYELFVCAELAIESIQSLSAPDSSQQLPSDATESADAAPLCLQLPQLVQLADDKYCMARFESLPEELHTLVPLSIFMGQLLLNMHRFRNTRDRVLVQSLINNYIDGSTQAKQLGTTARRNSLISDHNRSRVGEVVLRELHAMKVNAADYEVSQLPLNRESYRYAAATTATATATAAAADLSYSMSSSTSSSSSSISKS